MAYSRYLLNYLLFGESMMSQLKMLQQEPNSTEVQKTPDIQVTTKRYSPERIIFEKQWTQHPESFDPSLIVEGKQRLKQTQQFIDTWAQRNGGLKGKRIADLGCGMGHLSVKCALQGAEVTALDIAKRAYDHLKKQFSPLPHQLKFVHEDLLFNHLESQSFDLVICTHTIADLSPRYYRLCLSECARLLRPKGEAIFSTDLDINSVDALERFISLIETEFTVQDYQFAHHRLYTKWKNILKITQQRIETIRNPRKRLEFIQSKQRWLRPFYSIQISTPTFPIWKFLNRGTSSLLHRMQQNNALLMRLERLSKWRWDIEAISQIILVGEKKSLER